MRSAVVDSDRMVEPANTVVDSEILQTHRLTESDGTESIASSGFLNMFGRDLERASVVVRADTEQDVMDDDESLVSGRSGASDVSGGGLSEHKRSGAGRSHTHSPVGHTDPSKRIGEFG